MSGATMLLSMAKTSGRCPPSLIGEGRIIEGSEFESKLLSALDGASSQGLILSSEPNAAGIFTSAMKMAQSSEGCGVPALEQRRCLLLAVLGSTAETMPNNLSLISLMKADILVTIKSWLSDILEGNVGGVDLLLHLLSMITSLPVTKDMVTSSRLGKAVSAVEKHKICVGTKNEAAIKNRISEVKSRWSASVKAQKSKATSGTSNAPVKRQLAEEISSPPPVKKTKVEAPRASSLSNLLKKVESKTPGKATITPPKPKESFTIPKTAELKENNGKKKEGRRIQWADSSGGALARSQSDEAAAATEKPKRRKSRWADSTKKKDLMHEKEMLMLSRSKKAKAPVVDEDKEELLNAMTMMAMWKQPQPLPKDKENPPVHVDSNEIAVQTSRMSSIPPVTYADESAVPISPALLDEVEKALELTSRNTAPPTEIPFFTPQAPAPGTNFSASMFPPPPPVAPSFPPPPPQPPMSMSNPPSSEATLETVLMMGLPLFLVGQNVQALQTLQASPGLLNAYKDQAGVYNQAGLISLVQTLTQNAAPPTTSQTQYTAAYQPSAVPFAQPPTAATSHSGSGYRGDQNSGDANMHLSGYGPSTTVEDIINLFSPYVHVVEVVTKDKFSFVNTNDSEGAKRAREALNGALLGGMPCRINVATRKAKNPNHIPSGVSASMATSTLPRNALGQVDYDQVRDDRGNAATKNLFIAGYGPGTTDQQLRDIVGTYANVLSVTNKGTYAFVNTESRESAVLARDALTGQTLNGSLLRINFAKETGRLGTSFAAGASASHGHYGR